MIDYLWETRQALIENFQTSMRAIRLLMGYSIIELAEYIGVTRQTINNLETGKSKMSTVQFLSLAAVVDNHIATNGDAYQTIETILNNNSRQSTNRFETSFSGFSLLKRWFLLFEGIGAEIESNQGEALNSAQMRQLVQGYKIFLDDTAQISDGSEVFITGLANVLISENGRIIIPLRAIERIQEKTMDSACACRAVSALRLLNWMQQKNIIQIRGEENDSNLSDTILSVFLKFRGTHRLCLITQDRVLANKVLRLNEARDCEGFKIAVGYIAEGGQLVMYTLEAETQRTGTAETPSVGDNEEPSATVLDDDLSVLTESNLIGPPNSSKVESNDGMDTQDNSSNVSAIGWEYL